MRDVAASISFVADESYHLSAGKLLGGNCSRHRLLSGIIALASIVFMPLRSPLQRCIDSFYCRYGPAVVSPLSTSAGGRRSLFACSKL